jgi:hypothetical protein
MAVGGGWSGQGRTHFSQEVQVALTVSGTFTER